MKAVWLLKAATDRESQILCIAEQNRQAAVDSDDAIEHAARRLEEHRLVGRLGRVRGTREPPVAGTKFVLIYRVQADRITILRLLHGAQRWPEQR